MPVRFSNEESFSEHFQILKPPVGQVFAEPSKPPSWCNSRLEENFSKDPFVLLLRGLWVVEIQMGNDMEAVLLGVVRNCFCVAVTELKANYHNKSVRPVRKLIITGRRIA